MGLSIFIIFSNQILGQEARSYQVRTIAFYNLENLFDTINDPITFDDDRTPMGKDHWTGKVYRQKLANMAKVIHEIGREVAQMPPAIVGVAEIENHQVLEDLLNEKQLRKEEYGIVQFDSPDRRGIDVGLLYLKSVFQVKNSTTHTLYLYHSEDANKRVFTRDQLVVSGYLDRELIHFIVNHWPSRSGGEAKSRHKREAAAALNVTIIDSINANFPNAKIISMGDLNDDPTNSSLKKVLRTEEDYKKLDRHALYNPFENMYKKGLGTLAYRDTWNLFDQMLLSEPFLRKEFNGWQYFKSGIFNAPYLFTPDGQYKGYPFRSFANGAFTGGYSDHFPVYVYLIREVQTSD
ncbi:MAG: endonuclease/exonuclease/phosphatase family protein [Leeuwenhoekiella sp.]